MDDGGDAPSIAVITILIHPKKRLRDLKSKKRNAEDIVVRMTTRTHTEVAGTSVCERSNVIIVCGNKCLPIDDRYPERSDCVRECMTKERFDKEVHVTHSQQ